MNEYLRKKIQIVILFLCFFYKIHCQSTIWNVRGKTMYQPQRLHSSEYPRSHIYPRGSDELAENSYYYQPVYGPQRQNDACSMKASILDERAIDATRESIRQCTQDHDSCYYAKHSKYRAIDGSCNNIKNPEWGKSEGCLQRILPFDYADRISKPRVSCTGNPLPNPRLVSNVFHQQKHSKKDDLTTAFMEWGQMLAHDLSLNDVFKTPESGYNLPIQCCNPGPVINDRCFSLPVPPGDPFYPKYGVTCISFARTVPCPVCRAGQRVHWNQNTGYHDLSLVYGSTPDEAQKLRSGDRGMLDVDYTPKAGPILPSVPIEDLCVSPPGQSACFKAGDTRVNQNPFLIVVHTYLMRHHNFICQELSEVNPHWDDEKLYQEGRRLNIAIAQFITYSAYLPNVLGEIMQKEGINVLPGAKYTKYDPELEPTIADEYATAAARYGHTLIPSRLSQIDPKTNEEHGAWLRDLYYNPFGFRYGMYDETAKGMTVDRKEKHDVFLVDDVRNYLYRRTYLNETTGRDLAAVSILRGRDHGIPGYTYYLSYFFNITIRSFEDLEKVLPAKSVELLEGLYESPHDIDLYSAGLAEYYVPGGFVGPTFGAILGQQYKRIKFGDRYWFEHGNEAGSFTPEQLLEIKRSSIARIFCETTRIRKIQKKAFRPPSAKNPVVSCEEIHRFNFELWRE
uniref:Peroxidase n=1 Tax=Parasteatoda tepidariorum TaxID=114398 RepID=A0A2L2Y7L8_PARTP